jgi:uncharacterized protein (DUF1499 family)
MQAVRLLTLIVALAAAALLALSGPGVRLGFWSWEAGFGMLRWGAYVGASAAALALVQLVVARWRGPRPHVLAVAAVLGILAFTVPNLWVHQARGVPPIHDISTDTTDPPSFNAVLMARGTAPNSAIYGGRDIAEQQQRAYPDIRPVTLDVTPRQAFERALDAARAMGWIIVAAEPGEGRIEATATTRWFGFKDDVVVRVRPAGGGASRVDVRSVSRVGQSDVGANATRIRAFLSRLA